MVVIELSLFLALVFVLGEQEAKAWVGVGP